MRRGPVSEYGEMWAELVRSRELLRSLIGRDLLVRYKQTVLGIAWAMLVPTLSMFVFTVVFTRIAPLETEVPYPIYAYSGLLPWTFFAASLRAATVSLTGNPNLVTKVAFPREVFPISAVSVGFVDFLAASTVLGGLMAYYGVVPSWTAVLVPGVVLLQVAFTLGLGFILAAGNLYYRDVGYLVSVLIGLWMFATSVVYPVERVGGKLGVVLQWNPMTPIIDAYRSLLLRGELPSGPWFPVAAAVSVLVLAFGWRVFHRAEPRFAEIV